jgi:hypothetical protein
MSIIYGYKKNAAGCQSQQPTFDTGYFYQRVPAG